MRRMKNRPPAGTGTGGKDNGKQGGHPSQGMIRASVAPVKSLTRKMDAASTAAACLTHDLAALARETHARGFVALALIQNRVAELLHEEIEDYVRAQEGVV